MSKLPDLTISIVSYNTKELVIAGIRSIQEKTQDICYEIIVVDNESKDGSPEAIRALFPEVKVIKSGKNMGFSAATNIALQHARGRYFVLFNADASLQNNAFSDIVSFMDSHKDCGIACPQLYYPDGRVQVSHYPFRFPGKRSLWEVNNRLSQIKKGIVRNKKPAGSSRQHIVPEQPLRVQRPRGVCFVIRMECVQEIGPMDANFFIFCEEVDWAWRAKQAGWKRYLVPSAKVDHINHASVGRTGGMMEKIHMQSDYYYFYKHFGMKAWLALRFGNLMGAGLAYTLALLTFVKSQGKSGTARQHFSEGRILWTMATLTRKVLPPDAR